MTAPRWAAEFEDLAAVATDLSAKRSLAYPDAVARGILSAAQAEAGLRIMAAIAADWRRHVDLVQRRFPATIALPAAATREERIATLEHAARRAAELAARKAEDGNAAAYAEFVETLLWWERQPFGIRFITDVNLELRRRDASAQAAA